jgi:hypothetical protein
MRSFIKLRNTSAKELPESFRGYFRALAISSKREVTSSSRPQISSPWSRQRAPNLYLLQPSRGIYVERSQACCSSNARLSSAGTKQIPAEGWLVTIITTAWYSGTCLLNRSPDHQSKLIAIFSIFFTQK